MAAAKKAPKRATSAKASAKAPPKAKSPPPTPAPAATTPPPAAASWEPAPAPATRGTPASPSPSPLSPPGPGPAPRSSDERTLGLVAHILLILTWWLGPLILWLIKRGDRGFAEDQAREALNFGITLTLVAIALAILLAILEAVSGGLFPDAVSGLVWVAGLVFGILAAVEANRGAAYRYPISLRLVKAPGA